MRRFKKTKLKENKEFSKKDLKNRMFVECRNPIYRRMVCDNMFMGSIGYADFDDYNEDLTHKQCPALDIMRVYAQNNTLIFLSSIKTDFNSSKIIWERSKIKDVTMEDIEEKFGCKVKIVKEKEE